MAPPTIKLLDGALFALSPSPYHICSATNPRETAISTRLQCLKKMSLPPLLLSFHLAATNGKVAGLVTSRALFLVFLVLAAGSTQAALALIVGLLERSHARWNGGTKEGTSEPSHRHGSFVCTS